MPRIALSLSLLIVAFAGSAGAQPTTNAHHVMSPAPKYWLSEGLNRLVFWRPGAPARTLPQGRSS